MCVSCDGEDLGQIRRRYRVEWIRDVANNCAIVAEAAVTSTRKKV